MGRNYCTLQDMKTDTVRWFDWFSAFLLVAAFVTVAMRLQVTQWTSNLEVIELLVFIASILGLMLGASQFNELACQLFAINYSLFFIPWQLGLLVGTKMDWDQRLLALINRLSYSITEVVNNRPIQDPLLFITTMSIFFWILAMLAGYQLTRHGRPWVPLFLLGLALAIIDFYTPYQDFRDRYSGIFVFFILLLVARLYYLHSRRKWRETGVAVDPEIGFDLGRTVLFSGLALVLIAWNIPTLVDALTPGTSIQKELAKQWESISGRLHNAVAGLQNPVGIVTEYYGPELALGTGGAQGEEVVFTVQVAGGAPEGVRLYWRARSLDVFDGSQWKTSLEKTKGVLAYEWPFKYADLMARKEIQLFFSPNTASMRNVFAPGLPLSVSHPLDVLAEIRPDGTADILALISNPSIRIGETIRIRSWISMPTISKLSQVEKIYPQDIKERYLQLPNTLPARIPALARQITAGKTTPFDQVSAITRWLRDNIEYQDTIDSAPPGRDIVDWFLFDYKKGYCNYYATAEVILLRSIGIPARLAIGYAEGESERSGELFTVRRKNSHAWPEVYFEGFGWLEFEPTSSQPQIVLPSGTVENYTSNPVDPPVGPLVLSTQEEPFVPASDKPQSDSTRTQLITIVIVAVVLGLLAGVFLWLKRHGRLNFMSIPMPVLITASMEKRNLTPPAWLKNWARQIELSPMERMYSRVSWMLRLFGKKAQIGQTPAERIAVLVEVEPRTSEPARAFLREFQLEEYSTRHGSLDTAQKANQRLWKEVLTGAIRQFFRG